MKIFVNLELHMCRKEEVKGVDDLFTNRPGGGGSINPNQEEQVRGGVKEFWGST